MKLHAPLDWPVGWVREHGAERARFDPDLTRFQAHNQLTRELELLGATEAILSSDLELKLDGRPSARQPRSADTGVALYYTLDGAESVIACDRWHRMEHNVRAVTLTIQALRGIDRWGAGQVGAAFRGFLALPEHAGGRAWWQVLGLDSSATSAQIETAYRDLARRLHPDAGGDVAAFQELNEAYQQARSGVQGPREMNR